MLSKVRLSWLHIAECFIFLVANKLYFILEGIDKRAKHLKNEKYIVLVGIN